MTEEQTRRALLILQHYSGEKQMLKCVEELTELTEAIMKHINKGGVNTDEIFEEIVDVEIMLEQIKWILPYGIDRYETEIDRKLNRQLARIKEGSEEEPVDCSWK